MNDFEYQACWVIAATERLCSLLDKDPLSPTWGCAHLAFWRDKTSPVADTRRQELMWPLAMLYTSPFPTSTWQGHPNLANAIQSLLNFWCRSQYTDGSFDEWYKGERAFAAAAFSTHAVARTLNIFGPHLPRPLLTLTQEKLACVSTWLIKRDDLFKSNHQAVGVAALAWAGHVLNSSQHTHAARTKLEKLLAIQTPAGWFPEVGHMDLGYTFLTVEFAAFAMDLWNDWSQAPALSRAFQFACQWLHPDLTLRDEYGICHNTYVSRLAALLLSPHSGYAAWCCRQFSERSIGFTGIQPTLADDLRLPRWAFQPLVAYQYATRSGKTAVPQIPPLAIHQPEAHIDHDVGLARIVAAHQSIVVAACAGGLVCFVGENAPNDHGYAIVLPSGYATNQTYNRQLPMVAKPQRIIIETPMPTAKKFMPSFIARVILHYTCSTAWSSRWMRRLIDYIRKRKGTAINQSSANLSQTATWWMKRSVSTHGAVVEIADELIFDRLISSDTIFLLLSKGHSAPTLTPLPRDQVLPKQLKRIILVKEYLYENGWRQNSIQIKV